MKMIVYVCAKVRPQGFYRRIRITIDGTKVTSVEVPPENELHESCYHRATIHPNPLNEVPVV